MAWNTAARIASSSASIYEQMNHFLLWDPKRKEAWLVPPPWASTSKHNYNFGSVSKLLQDKLSSSLPPLPMPSFISFTSSPSAFIHVVCVFFLYLSRVGKRAFVPSFELLKLQGTFLVHMLLFALLFLPPPTLLSPPLSMDFYLNYYIIQDNINYSKRIILLIIVIMIYSKCSNLILYDTITIMHLGLPCPHSLPPQ